MILPGRPAQPPALGPRSGASATDPPVRPGPRSRDVLLLFGCLLALGGTVLFLWAGMAEGLTTVWIGLPLLGGPIPSGIFLAASAGLLACSLAGILLLRRGTTQAAGPHGLLPLTALLLSFALLETARLLYPDQGTILLDVVQVNIVLLVVLWIFYRRGEVSDAVLLIAGWFAALLPTRRTLSSAFSAIDTPRAAFYTQAFVAGETLLFAALCLLPLGIMSRVFRSRLAIWRPQVARLGLALRFGNLLLGGLVFWGALRFSERTADMLIFSIATQGFVISLVVMLVTRAFPREIHGRAPDGGRRREAAFRALLAVVCLGYVLFAARVAASWPMDNYPDTLSYLSIARQYAEGSPVIRGYWSPLASWLLAPPLRFGVEPYVAYNAVAVVVGLAWIFVSVALARLLGLGHGLQLAVAASVGFVVIGAGISHGLPDLAGALLLATYFCVLLRPDYPARPIRNGALAGALGALAYLAKQYNLPFVLVHLGVTHALRIASGAPKKAAAKAFVSAALTLLAVSLPWAMILSLRYHHLTFGTTGALAHAIVGPRMTDHPCNTGILCAEPDDVLFSGEDPAESYYPDLGWSPLASLENFRHELRLIADNLREWLPSASFYVGILPALGLVGVGLMALKAWPDPERRFLPAWISLTAVLYITGYLFFPSLFRYYLAIIPLLFAGVYLSLARIVGEGPLPWRGLREASASLTGVLAVVLALLSMARPPVLRFLLTEPSPYTCLETDSLALAGIVEAPLAGTDWRVFHVAFHTRTRTLGWLSPNTSALLVDQELRANSVRSFLVGDGPGLATDLVRDYGYTVRGSAMLCRDPYLILIPPPSR